MLRRLISFFHSRFSSEKKAPSLKPFHTIETALRHLRARPRPAFEQTLKTLLRARYESMQEDRLANLLHAFRIPRWATATLVVILLVGGGTIVGASPAPIPKAEPFGEFSMEEHPDFAPITLTFDQPMVMSSVEEAFQIEPAVEGRFVWSGRREVLFIPELPLDTELTYTITLSIEAKSLYQKKLSKPYQQSLQVQHVELPSSDDPDLDFLQELRQTDRTLTPKEKQFLHQKFKQMELSTFQEFMESKEAQREGLLEDEAFEEETSPSHPPLWWIRNMMSGNGDGPKGEFNPMADNETSDTTSASDWNVTATSTVDLE